MWLRVARVRKSARGFAARDKNLALQLDEIKISQYASLQFRPEGAMQNDPNATNEAGGTPAQRSSVRPTPRRIRAAKLRLAKAIVGLDELGVDVLALDLEAILRFGRTFRR